MKCKPVASISVDKKYNKEEYKNNLVMIRS